VWLEAPDAELDEIDRVEYKLHPTFSRPTRIVTDRRTNFRLDGSAWGQFRIGIVVHRKSGESDELSHWLRLMPDAPSKEPAPMRGPLSSGDAPTLFFSYASVDGEFVDRLVSELRNRGAVCLLPDDLSTSESFTSGIDDLVKEANFAVAVISDAYGGWVEREVEHLRRSQVAILPLIVGELRRIPEFLNELKGVPVGPDDPPEQIADHLLGFAADLGFL
jgi:hypothetical protein